MIRANFFKDREAIMAWFSNGLNRDIVNMVELQYYLEIEDMMYMAIKVEKQLKRKGNARLDDYLGSSQDCKSNFRIEDNTQIKSITVSKVIEPSYVKKQVTTTEEKRRNNVRPKHKWEIKYFKCQGLG